MAVITDKEFGDITVRRSALSSRVKLSIAPNGSLRVSVPRATPLLVVRGVIASSRRQIRTLLDSTTSATTVYAHGDQIGKSHRLELTQGTKLTTTIHGQTITVSYPRSADSTSRDVQLYIRQAVIKALRKEAKSYLPRRLEHLARTNGFSYQTVRFSHASTRWGSCSSDGVISLNIALMKLPFETIDYVLLHELSHTKHMDHSKQFWTQLHSVYPHYEAVRKSLKLQQPSI